MRVATKDLSAPLMSTNKKKQGIHLKKCMEKSGENIKKFQTKRQDIQQ
jgi:hypothetical protein